MHSTAFDLEWECEGSPEQVVCKYEEVDAYKIIDDVFEKLTADVKEAGGAFDADNHVAAFKRIHDRVGVMMAKSGRQGSRLI